MKLHKSENVYQDQVSGGWVVELLVAGRWHRVGIFGCEAEALQCVALSRR